MLTILYSLSQAWLPSQASFNHYLHLLYLFHLVTKFSNCCLHSCVSNPLIVLMYHVSIFLKIWWPISFFEFKSKFSSFGLSPTFGLNFIGRLSWNFGLAYDFGLISSQFSSYSRVGCSSNLSPTFRLNSIGGLISSHFGFFSKFSPSSKVDCSSRIWKFQSSATCASNDHKISPTNS